MEHEMEILKAKLRILESENYALREKSREKNKEIKFLQKIIKKLELQVPKRVNEYQMSLKDFV